MTAIAVGWREWVALPELGLPKLRAKVDTGARSSSLHVERQWRFVDGGAPWVGFALVPRLHAGEVEAAAAIVDERVVTDSGGHLALRVFVRTKLRLAGIQREIEMNLADGCGMRFTLLLGRTALAGAFVVEPGGSYLHRRRRVLRPSEAPRDV